MGIFVVRERMEPYWGWILPTLVGLWWCSFPCGVRRVFEADVISGVVKCGWQVNILMTIIKLAFCWGKWWNLFAAGAQALPGELRDPLGWGWGCSQQDGHGEFYPSPSAGQGWAYHSVPLEKCTQERTKHLLAVTAEVKSVRNSPMSTMVEGGVGGDLARPSPETSSRFSPVQHRTLELGSAGESQHCPHPCQMMELGWILLLASSFTLLLPRCGGFKAEEPSLHQETGWQRPASLGGGLYTDKRAGGQNRKQKSLIFAQIGSVKKKGNQRSWSKGLPKQGD